MDSGGCGPLIGIPASPHGGGEGGAVKESSLCGHIDCPRLPSCTVDCTQQVDEWMRRSLTRLLHALDIHFSLFLSLRPKDDEEEEEES